jgi:hypothetical protein
MQVLDSDWQEASCAMRTLRKDEGGITAFTFSGPANSDQA